MFIHDALLESVESGDTEVAARDLKAQYRYSTVCTVAIHGLYENVCFHIGNCLPHQMMIPKSV